ncbi:MAG TPA: DUF6599 family protein [Bryobacteraceae bacterium]|nr:DUF6599 family protein [Bryobacteraceae bacterium]
MLRCLIALLASAGLYGALLPERFGSYTKTSSAAAVSDAPALWTEYGLNDSERAEYAGRTRTFAVSAWQLKDSTGAAAAFDWQRPPASRPTGVAQLAVQFPGGALVAFGNYLLRFDRWQPDADQIVDLVKALPKLSRASLPPLRAWLPADGRVRGSERYVVGPISLEAFAPAIPAAIAGFQHSAEACVARYWVANREATLAVFAYPTPHIARERTPGFEQLAGAQVHRSGPLVAVMLGAPSPAAAASVLEKVRYQAEFSWTEHVAKDTPQDAARMILAILMLAAILILSSVVLGVFFGAFRALFNRLGIAVADESFTMLDLSKK